ncbi:MAG: ABC transporter ATP-binding protein [Chloroflexota bacterium]
MKTLRRLMPFFRRYLPYQAVAILSMMFLTLAGLIRPWLTKILVDQVLGDRRYDLLVPLVLATIGISLVRGLFNYGQQYFGELSGQHLVFDLRTSLYRHLQQLSFSYYDKAQTGQLMSRLTGDVDMVRQFFSFGLVHMFDFFFMIGFGLIIIVRLDWQLTLICLAFVPFMATLIMRFDRKIRPVFKDIQQQMATLTAGLQENISGVRAVKSFAREPHEMDKFAGNNTGNMNRNMKAARLFSDYLPLMNFMGGISVTLVLWYGGRQVINGDITIGTLIAFTNYMWYLIGPLDGLGWLVNMLEQALASGERLLEILDTPRGIADLPGAVELKDCRGAVRFENVSFAYEPGNEVLRDISFDVPAGSTCALVGATGSGKSSIISLLGRFYEPSSGRITIDGRDVRSLTLESLRRNIGSVLQETFLFSATIRDNIAYGNPDAPLCDVVAAAKAARAHDFIMEMKDEYETTVGERGTGLSGGQKQRVAIARALLVDPAILVLDDATSSVDMETEYEIQAALSELMQTRTTFVIAHRISSVKNADQILVLDRGRIVERGRHEDLLARGGIYKQIYDVQFRDQEAVRETAARVAGEGGNA